jgi:hypothetical protein
LESQEDGEGRKTGNGRRKPKGWKRSEKIEERFRAVDQNGNDVTLREGCSKAQRNGTATGDGSPTFPVKR